MKYSLRSLMIEPLLGGLFGFYELCIMGAIFAAILIATASTFIPRHRLRDKELDDETIEALKRQPLPNSSAPAPNPPKS